ncbi:Aldehyde/histidinol dehydrogenase [Lineolata rhizophorae]|uniref:Aldehyde/histidinol dehydrogenase n=1 Tax=Lineolata rhizophorae TaxID=578093 RepID=A0A6A6NMU8_9PEZI|nr:Aldehyde/histidinol dehydrogenase [Lineolata rhizophorae]
MAMPNGTATQASPTSLSDEQLLFIDGEYTKSSKGSTFPVKNPMTGEQLYQSAAAGKADYEIAIQNAHEAFKSWSSTPPSARRLIFLKAADILESYLKQDAPEILSAEVSAVPSWVKVNVLATAGILRETAGLVTHIKGEIVPADRPGTTIMVLREAVGVVFAMSPWNAPVNLTARAIATPLICGNTVILKPSEFSPKSQHLVVRALRVAGLPKGCLNFLPTSPADAPATTEFAIKHPLVRRVNFTGSSRVGRIIAGHAASVLKQCVLELGGKAPALVLRDATIPDAVDAIVFGALSNSGQICMSTERVIVDQAIKDEFISYLLERVAKVRYGNLLDPAMADVSMSGLFCAASTERVIELCRDAISQGAKLLAGDLEARGPQGTILSPIVLDGVTRDMAVFRDETFGPVMCLCAADGDDHAVAVANDSEYSLCASVFSADVMRALAVARRVRAGSCHVNGPTVYIEATLPNGGTGGASGYGRFGGIAGVEEFTERKIVSLAEPGMTYSF